MLSVVPGISPTMARSLLSAYGSLSAIAAADDLRRHPGIGPVLAARLTEALGAEFVAHTDREPEPERLPRRARSLRRWALTSPRDPEGEAESYDRKAIALRALRSAAEGTQLIDTLTGEVVAEAQTRRAQRAGDGQPLPVVSRRASGQARRPRTVD